MRVKLSNGVEIDIMGPVVKPTKEGVFISHCEFNAEIDGIPAIISSDELVDAKFPDDVAEQVEKEFKAALPDVERVWSKLRKFYADRGEQA